LFINTTVPSVGKLRHVLSLAAGEYMLKNTQGQHVSLELFAFAKAQRREVILLMAMLLVIVPVAALNPPEAILEFEPDPSEGILEGVPVRVSAEDSNNVFEIEHTIELRDNGNIISTEKSVMSPFKEGDHNLSLYIETTHGNDTVYRNFYVYANPPPEIEGVMKYYDSFNDRETKSNKELSVPQFGSVSIVVWNEEDAERDDETSYSTSISQPGLEIANSEEDGDNTTFYLFASETGKYDVLFTATDDAGQESSANFVVRVETQKDLEIEMSPDDVLEGAEIKFQLEHPCQDDVCKYTTSVIDIDYSETHYVEGEEFTWYFDDEGPYNVISNVTYNGSVIASHKINLFVDNIEDDPPSIIINVTTPALVGEPINITLRAYDDGKEVEVIDVIIYGDYEDETRHTSKRVVGDSGTITFIARQTGSYRIVAKTCDKMQCSEETFYFEVLKNSTEVDEQEEIIEETLPDEETQEDTQNQGDTKTPGFRGLIAIMALLIIHVKMRRY